MKAQCNYTIIFRETTEAVLVIRDVGPWDRFRTVTNNAEAVVAELHELGVLRGRRLLYYDTDGSLDELRHVGGQFTGFLFGGQP